MAPKRWWYMLVVWGGIGLQVAIALWQLGMMRDIRQVRAQIAETTIHVAFLDGMTLGILHARCQIQESIPSFDWRTYTQLLDAMRPTSCAALRVLYAQTHEMRHE